MKSVILNKYEQRVHHTITQINTIILMFCAQLAMLMLFCFLHNIRRTINIL